MMKFITFLSTLFFAVVSLSCYAFQAKQSDEYYMQLAIEQAKLNPRAPFGAVVVDNETGEVLGQGVNASSVNPTFHGEMVAINDCVKKHPHVNWAKATLYTTAEPCSMCQSAIIWAGIPRVVFATSISYLLTHGWHQINLSAAQVNAQAPFYKGSLTSGVLSDRTDPMFNRR